MQTDFNKFLTLIENQNTTMLTTKQNDGLLRSRPMKISKLEQDGTIWFFNNENSCKANEILQHPQVNLNFINDDKSEYVSYSGQAEIVTDKTKIEELMTPMVKAWFPKGSLDPSISLIKVNFEKGAFWVNEESNLKQLFEITRAIVTGTKANLGEHETVDTNQPA